VKTWVKLYTEINRDPKMLRLTWAQRGIWSALLALAGEIDDQDEDGITGYVGPLDDVALLIRCDDDEFSEAIRAFAERGMVENREGILYLSRYVERQQRAPSNAREAVTERVQRHRRRQADGCNEDVTSLHAQCNEDVTRLQRGVTPSDSDSDSDSDSEADAERAAAAPQPRARAGPPRLQADARKDAPIIQAVREIMRAYPPKGVWDKLIRDICDPPDLAKMRVCYETWCARGYKPMNLAWLFEWYVQGIPPAGNGRKTTPARPQTMADVQTTEEALAIAAQYAPFNASPDWRPPT